MRRDGDQVRRLPDRRLPLRQAHVGAADHPHLAVGPGPGRRPFDGVVAVACLLPHGVELALRAVAAARVLVQGGVAALGEIAAGGRIAVGPGGGRAPVVGRPLEDHRERAVSRRQVHLGRQPDAVAHRRLLDAAGHAGGVVVGCEPGSPESRRRIRTTARIRKADTAAGAATGRQAQSVHEVLRHRFLPCSQVRPQG